MKASLCLEAAERPQWPRLYSLGRPMSCDRNSSLVGDRGPVLGWALECAIYCWYYAAVEKKPERWLCVEQSRELFSNIKGRGGASNACFHS